MSRSKSPISRTNSSSSASCGRPLRSHWQALAVLTLASSIAATGCMGDNDPAATQGPSETTSYAAQTRTYFIAADDVVWDYAPSGINQITGEPFDDAAMCSSPTAPTGSASAT